MSKFTKFTLGIAAAAAIAATVNVSDAEAKKGDKEKCYGIVKKGHNDCASSDGKHSCAGHATKSGSKTEWILLPKGLCERIDGGITKS